MLKQKTNKNGSFAALISISVLLLLIILLENISDRIPGLPAVFLPTSQLFTVLKKGAVYSLVAVSMNLLNGFTGLFSLGQAGFMLLGAYTYAILTVPMAAKDQVLSGWYAAGGWVHIGNEWGANAGVSFYNTPRYASKPSDDTMKLHYDDAVKSVGVGDTFVIDFDNAQYFPTSGRDSLTENVFLASNADNMFPKNPLSLCLPRSAAKRWKGIPFATAKNRRLRLTAANTRWILCRMLV